MPAGNVVLAATTEEIAVWLTDHLVEARGLSRRAVERGELFSRHGLDSLGAAKMIADLSTFLGRPLSATLVWEYPTIESLSAHLGSDRKSAPDRQRRALSSADPVEPIAICGLSCRLPGASDIPSFWKLLREGRSAVAHVPHGRWDERVLKDSAVGSDERSTVVKGAFLDRVDGFDPLFFGISPREAAAMDPQQRLLLELTWEALEDAGVRPSSIKGTDTAVLIGAIWSDYAILSQQAGIPEIGPYTVTGTHHSILANRISYLLGLHGPSFSIDSACSSGLVVAHLAAESLRSGESTMAIVGAVNLDVLPESALGVARFGALSKDGQCYTFDGRANGYVRGEGGGILVLKRLSAAIADGNPIYCVLRGSAVNNDGASNGLTAPNPKAQEDVLRKAYRRAGVDPSEVQYVEAHGTGTPLGDPIEARALGAVIGAAHGPDRPLFIGSAKTNIGHLEGAAGTAGLIKMALSIQHRLLPPSRNYQVANPHVDLPALGLSVTTELSPWPAPDRKLLAGVSSFGLGGTNGHVVVEEWPAPPSQAVLVSASNEADLRAVARDLLTSLDGEQALSSLAEVASRSLHRALSDVGDPESNAGAPHCKKVFVARSHGDLRRSIEKWLSDEAPAAASPGVDISKGPVFVFPGQGAQWHGMARSLLHREPVFRSTLERCDRGIRAELGWSLIDELTASRAESRLGDIEVSLPAIISIDIAVATYWRSLGIEPAAVVGHSTGEIAAAYVAGALDLEDTMKVICAYGKLITRLSDRGGMALVGLPWDEAEGVLAGFEGRVFRAIADSAEATVLAGEPGALDALVAIVSQKGVFCRRVAMNVSPHCPLVDELRDELFERLKGIRPRRSSVPLISEVTGAEVPGESLDAAHWVKNFGDPAFFSRAIDHLIDRGHRVFIDVGPHPITKHSVETNLRRATSALRAPAAPGAGVTGRVLSSLRRDEDERTALLDSLAALDALGLPVRWEALYPDTSPSAPAGACVLPLTARSPEALLAQARALGEALVAEDCPPLRDVLYTASVRRDHHRHRLAVVGSSAGELSAALAAAASGQVPEGAARGEASLSVQPKVVFVLPGQGSQWVGMGRELYREEEAFREALRACDAEIQREAGFSVVDELFAEEAVSRLGEIDVVQPILFAVEVALGALWRAWGVEPSCVIGHSMGEAAAAHIAGILSLADAAKVMCRRSKLLRRRSGQGAMALVELTRDEAEIALRGYESELSVAVSNGPRSTVISGDPGALDRLLAGLEERGVFCRRVKVDVASHSPQMDALTGDLLAELRDLAPQKARVPMRSTVTGELVEGPELDASYWVKNLRCPVLFSTAVTRSLGSDATPGSTLFLELSPHPLLLPSIVENIAEARAEGGAFASTRRKSPERTAMLATLGELFVRGVAIDWGRLLPQGGRVVPLPTYRWSRDRYWIERDRRTASVVMAARDGHPLVGQVLIASDRPNVQYWEQSIDTETLPYLADHRVQGAIVLPGAAYVEMALAAASTLFEGEPILLENVVFDQVLPLAAGEPRRVQLAVSAEEGVQASIVISSREPGGSEWKRHAWGTARAALAEDVPWRPPQEIMLRCPLVVEGEEHRASMAARRIDFGPAFQGLSRIWVGEGEALGFAKLPEAAGSSAGYNVHPALLDACFQMAAVMLDQPDQTWVPAALDRFQLVDTLPPEVWVHVRWSGVAHRDGVAAVDLLVTDEEGRPLVEVERLWLQRLAQIELPDAFAGCVYATDWPVSEAPVSSGRGPGKAGTWIVFADDGGLGRDLADALRRDGNRCIEVLPGREMRSLGPDSFTVDPGSPDDFERLLASANDGSLRGLLHLWSLDATPADETTPERIVSDIRRSTVSVLAAVQAVARCALRDPPRLVLITRGAQPAAGGADVVCPSASALWGFARVLAAEHPELSTVRLDLDPARPPGELAAIAREVTSPDAEDQIAFRHGERLVARLDRRRLPAGDLLTFRSDGTYLVTGGLTGLGLSLARWMVRQGARHMVLLGRRAPSDAAKIALEEMAEEGASVLVRSADVSVPEDLARVLAEVRADMPPLRGVVHSAAILEDASVFTMAETTFWPPILPKAIGAWNLHVQLLDEELDFFVMYSSVASLLGSPGQANYAGANAFVDALAHVRRGMGLPATAIQWGPFSEIGLAAASESRGQRLSLRGIQSFTPEEGHRLFSRVLRHDIAEVGLIRMSVRHLFDFYPRMALAPFLERARQEEAYTQSRQTTDARFRTALVETAPAQRRGALERHLIEHVERVLRLPAGRIDPQGPFLSYGMDSLMSLEIRHRLEASLNIRLSAAVLYTYPNVASLVDHLLEEMDIDTTTPHQIVAPAGVAFPDIVDELSEGTAAAMLDEKLLGLEDYLK